MRTSRWDGIRLFTVVCLDVAVFFTLASLLACSDFVRPTRNLYPIAGATATPTSGETPLTVNFNGTGTDPDGTIASYTWNFGDGGSSTEQSPAYTYRKPGTFTATVTVTDDTDASDAASVTITVTQGGNHPPTVSASVNPTTGLAPLNVSFTTMAADIDGTIVSHSWEFGDGATSSQQNPSHVYQSAGNYTATVTVSDDLGATASASVMIGVGAAANQPPTAAAWASPAAGTAPLAVAFTGSGTDPDGTISSYSWSFGDGSSSTQQNPSHTYQSAGNYTATLTVKDNAGATGSASVSLSVSAPVNQPPSASVSANPTSGTAPLAVAFTGSGTDPDGTIVSYSWSFGDGGTSSQQNPSHTYQAAGNYTATLTVTDNAGATGSAARNITVLASNQPPLANAGPDQANLDPGASVSLNGSGSLDPDGGTLAYQWTQTAGPTVTLSGAGTATPSFVAPAMTTATYTFQLTVTDNGSPPASASDTVNIFTRVTYVNTIRGLFLDRGLQSNGRELGCVQCHALGKSRPQTPLTTYQEVYNLRSGCRSVLKPGGSMTRYLLVGEPEVVVGWIDDGLPEKN